MDFGVLRILAKHALARELNRPNTRQDKLSIGQIRWLLLDMGYVQLAIDSNIFSLGYSGGDIDLNLRNSALYEEIIPHRWIRLSTFLSMSKVIPPDRKEWNFARRRLQKQRRELEAIKLQLNEAGREWFSMDRWSTDDKAVLYVYLNPSDQKRYNTGRFTVRNYRDWLYEQGPIMKNPGRGTTARLLGE